MTLINSYLTQGKVKRVLARRPGEAGFSLIELVVVVAVLAVLAAIAIPAFTSITEKARASAGANTMASLVKECAVKHATQETGTNLEYAAINLDGYNAVPKAPCPNSGSLTFVSTTPAKWPSFTYNWDTNTKSCNDNVHNCKSGTW